MRLRVFIIDPVDVMREPFAMHVKTLGHEVGSASGMDSCPHYPSAGQHCCQEYACYDAIILGQELPILKGIDFIERRVTNGCKAKAANNAIICRPWSHDEQSRAKALGCHFFETPVRLSAISDWLKEVEENVSASRKLSPLPAIS